MPADHPSEIADGGRFAFGENWRSFLDLLDEGRIREATRSLEKLLGRDSLWEKRFVDVGSGSGLFSLAAMRLGASEVCSFDYDPSSVACAKELKGRFFPGDARWRILEGSVLDEAFLRSLGRFDVAYSWGVLHHTGEMWKAFDNVRFLVGSGGRLALAIYNDQGRRSRVWRRIKKAYCRTPRWLRPLLFLPIPLYYESKWMAADLVHGKMPFGSWRTQSGRGMSPWHDWLDWLGGYPFEVARPEDVVDFFHRQGFRVEKLHPCGDGWANNEFVFRAPASGNAEGA
jgi:2-polyprenyl-6-hydroxyphenyl methylase/3-demethylubiquinone-9 3-methyltransferase